MACILTTPRCLHVCLFDVIRFLSKSTYSYVILCYPILSFLLSYLILFYLTLIFSYLIMVVICCRICRSLWFEALCSPTTSSKSMLTNSKFQCANCTRLVINLLLLTYYEIDRSIKTKYNWITICSLFCLFSM